MNTCRYISTHYAQFKMDLKTRVNIDRAKATNYMIPVWWDDKTSFKQSDLGIPVVMAPDSSELGYSVYALSVDASTVGASPAGAGASEWRLVESIEFMYMFHAYIEKLQAALVTAEKIEALEIRTSKLEVLQGAKVGGFGIGNGRIGIVQSGDNPTSDGLSIYNDMIKFSEGSNSVFLGVNVAPGVLGMPIMGTFRHGGQGDKVGLYFDIYGSEPAFWDGSSRDVALKINRGVIEGFRPNGAKIKLTSSGYTIGKETIVIIFTTENYTVRLPADPEPWEYKQICGVNNQNYTLHGNGKYIWSEYNGDQISMAFSTGLMVYDGTKWRYM